MEENQETITLSSLEHYSYCPRQEALIDIEQVWARNIYTVRGDHAHERVDEPMERTENNIRIERALSLWSQKFGLSGRADVVEFHGKIPYPIEYKSGYRRTWRHEAIQVCAQALCLEEMFNVTVPSGAIFYCGSRTRREVIFDEPLRTTTLKMIEAVRVLLRSEQLPPPVNDQRCGHCSLKEACMPEITIIPTRIQTYQKSLFSIEE